MISPDEIVMVPMTRAEIDYAKYAVERHAPKKFLISEGRGTAINTLKTLRKAADAPIAERRTYK